MFDQVEIKFKLIELLKTLPMCKSDSTGREWTVRCPYCGDSKNPTHGHFSILIDTNSDRPLLYRCFKCNESGILNNQVLEDLGIYTTQSFIKDFKTYNLLSGKKISYNIDKPKTYSIPDINKIDFNIQEKLSYLNNRLGINLSVNEYKDYNIIFNFTDFMEYNNISKSIIKDRSRLELDTNYVGFLSSNKNKIVFRSVNDNGWFGRYYKVTIDVYNRSPNTFYGINNSIDLLYTDNIDIHIAEGTFDILSIYMNLREKNKNNSLYYASCGYSFSSIIKYLISIGICTNLNLHIYSDNDKTDEDHIKLLDNNFYRIWIDKIYIHRNTYNEEKDFGVSKEKIKEIIYPLY